jgi:hypothetical protein
MHFFGLYPWECLTCQEKFYNSKRHSESRSAAGEVYSGPSSERKVKPGSKTSPSK